MPLPRMQHSYSSSSGLGQTSFAQPYIRGEEITVHNVLEILSAVQLEIKIANCK